MNAVISGAIAEKEKWNYIVTMQPTSPTLKTKSLDKAIEYAIDKNLDALISAINRPHLSWKENDGKKIPNYKERLNRQYLPACYMETHTKLIDFIYVLHILVNNVPFDNFLNTKRKV